MQGLGSVIPAAGELGGEPETRLLPVLLKLGGEGFVAGQFAESRSVVHQSIMAAI